MVVCFVATAHTLLEEMKTKLLSQSSKYWFKYAIVNGVYEVKHDVLYDNKVSEYCHVNESYEKNDLLTMSHATSKH